jgi:hypothetical protein
MPVDNDLLGKDYIKQLEDARSLSNNLADEFMRMNNISESTKQKMKDIVGSLKGQADISDQITSLVQARDEFIENEVAAGRRISKNAIARLDAEIELLKLKEKQINLEKDIKDAILDQFGATEEIADIFKTGGILAAGAKAFLNSTQAISDAFSTTFGTAFEMYKTMGISAKEGAILAGEIGKARISMAGLLYDGEDFANASKALVDQFGNVNMATDDMVLGVTELSQLTGDAASAVGLALSFQNAGVAVDEVDSILKDIGSKTGVTANKIAKEMADNQYLMVGATKQELKLIGQLNAELIKQGATRESIRGSAKSLMDIENTIQQANKIALMTGKMVNTARLTEAAMQARTAEGAENKAKAQNELLKALKEELGVNGSISDQRDVTIEAMTTLSGLTEEQLLNMEQAGIAQKNNNKLIEEGNAFFGAITAGAQSFGAGIGSATLELVKMIAQAMIFNKVMSGSFGMGNLKFGKFGGGGGAGGAIGGGGGAAGGGVMNKVGSMGSGVGGALKGIAGGFAAFGNPQTIAGVAIITGAIIGLGFALKLAAPGIEAIGKAIATVIGGIGDFITKIATPETATGLLHLAPAFAALGLSFLPLAIGLAAITPVLPTLVALVALGAGIALIANALNGGGASETTTSNTKQSDPLLEEIRGLRADIKAQPINVVLNNKIVGEINRGSRAINSYVNK